MIDFRDGRKPLLIRNNILFSLSIACTLVLQTNGQLQSSTIEVINKTEECKRFPPKDVLFSSDNFLRKNNEDSGCFYEMEASQGKKVHLTFFVIDMEIDFSCYFGKLEVFEGNGTRIHKYCGDNLHNIEVVSVEEKLSFNYTFESYREQRSHGFLASWREVDEESDERTDGDSYLVSLPATFRQETEEKVCIKLLADRQTSGAITARVTTESSQDSANNNWMFRTNNKPAVEVEIKIKRNERNKCFELTLPKSEGVSRGLLEIEIKSDDGSLDIKTFTGITIYQQEIYPLIQTDKGHYKAKDKVKFRVLLLDHNLKPFQDLKSIDEIWVEDPRNRRIAQWKDSELDRGLLQREFSLSEEPVLGQYKISVTGPALKEAVSFTVSEYVLPKFSLSLSPPPAVTRDQQMAQFKVCAKYTHGGNVKGTFEARFHSKFIQRNWPQPPPVVRNVNVKDRDVERDGEGCGIIRLTRENIVHLTEKIDNFDLKVVFSEEGTGTKDQTSWTGRLVDQPIVLKVTGSNTFMTGGLPYTGEISVTEHAGAPRPNEPINICISLFKGISDVRMLFHRKNVWSMDEAELVEVGKKMAALQHSKMCHQEVTSAEGKIKFFVPLEREKIAGDVRKLSILVTATNFPANNITGMEQPSKKMDVSLTNSDLPLTLSLKDKPKKSLTCGETFKPKIYFASSRDLKLDLNYIAFSKGRIVASDTIKVITRSKEDSLSSLYQIGNAIELGAYEKDNQNQQVSQNKVFYEELELDINYKVSPSLKLVVFAKYEDRNLEDSQTYDIEPCQQHQVTVNWSTSKTNPGSEVELKVSSAPLSRCAMAATDKSVELLGNKNKISKEMIGKLQAQIGDRKTSRSENYWEYQRKCPQTYSALKSSGIEVATDLTVVKNCVLLNDAIGLSDNFEGPMNYPVAYMTKESDDLDYDMAMARGESMPLETFSPRVGGTITSGGPGRVQPRRPAVQLRTFFPENWLFDIQEPNKSGSIRRRLTAPHSLTTWVGEAFCLSSAEGLGVAEPSNLLVSQDFFSELRLPFSVKRGESFPLNISVFNYLPTELPLTVSLTASAEEIHTEASQLEVCVSGGSSEVVSFDATALSLGDLNITVQTQVTNGVPNCKPVERGDGFKDTLRKPIRVKPEGVPVEIVESEFKCLEVGGDSKFNFKPLSLPSSVVPQSERVWLTVTGDVMAPALDNVGRLVQLPTGCGEQNMAGLVPNIYLLQYLKKLGEQLPELEQKAVDFMMVGYNRQQKYRHPTGSYSIWGGTDEKKGSTWLTAFVVRAFSDAAEFIDVDPELVSQSISWLFQYQSEDGCFQNRGYVHSKYLKGGGSDDSLTAFVLTALLHARTSKLELEVPEVKLRSARDCMVRRLDRSDLYTSILATHAATLHWKVLGDSNTAELGLAVSDLTERANSSTGGKFWELERSAVECENCWWSYRPSSQAVEMTAYMVMTHVLREELPLAVASVKWLGRQRNSQGGFVSTQDTVLALQALSLYSQRVARTEQNVNIDVDIVGHTREKLFSAAVNDDNALLLRQEQIDQDLPFSLDISSSGTGCALVQTVLRYNTPEVTATAGFRLSAAASQLNSVLGEPLLSVCAAYTGTRANTGMVVLELELVTGWEAVSPHRILNQVEFKVQRVEQDEKDNKVVLYFDEMTRQETCVSLEVKEVTSIKNSKDAMVTVYDYYNREETATILYNMTEK